jgi:hypothetical protein
VYNLEVYQVHNYSVSDVGVLVHNSYGREGAFKEAKRDARIPESQQPFKIVKEPMTDTNGKSILGKDGMPIMTREYYFRNTDGEIIVIQDHSAGHYFNEGGVGDQGSHFNVRPVTNTRTGKVKGTKPHYEF